MMAIIKKIPYIKVVNKIEGSSKEVTIPKSKAKSSKKASPAIIRQTINILLFKDDIFKAHTIEAKNTNCMTGNFASRSPIKGEIKTIITSINKR